MNSPHDEMAERLHESLSCSHRLCEHDKRIMTDALKEASATALRDVCDELIEKYEGQGKTMTVAIMHIRAKAAGLRRKS